MQINEKIHILSFVEQNIRLHIHKLLIISTLQFAL